MSPICPCRVRPELATKKFLTAVFEIILCIIFVYPNQCPCCVYFLFVCLFFELILMSNGVWEERKEIVSRKCYKQPFFFPQRFFFLHCSRSNRGYDRPIDGDTGIFYSLNDYSHGGNFRYNNSKSTVVNNKRE
jgi:hypothetical protein